MMYMKPLYRMAKKRHPGKKIEPMPRHGWKDCLEIAPEYHFAALQYHVHGDKSSHCVMVEI